MTNKMTENHGSLDFSFSSSSQGIQNQIGRLNRLVLIPIPILIGLNQSELAKSKKNILNKK